ncbi:dickkopf-related protein 1b [Erpetoichthys calabaricus]|uniref:Dickkopf WNT signaling pathway inhibitor 1b n=1 Tax=Erpetoichthys calabaricus TaxID=27687 RepID=A0A8C4RK55_ERPCA|nr:dickkopf-related protein 1b [Erpetoichthys calabaricus]
MHLERARVLLAVSFTLCWHRGDAAAGSGILNSNAIKHLPGAGHSSGHTVSISPDVILYDNGNKNQAVDSYQHYVCGDDDDCASDEFCYGSRNVCLQCRKRRKRCLRDAMCCPGNHCSNGLCVPNEADTFAHVEPEDSIVESFAHDDHHFTMEPHPRRTTIAARTHTFKGQDGDVCLRSSDCAEGLCCARHFWSKICKPVLKEGQVCTRHRRKGTHGLEIFQRCDCGEGLSCKTQKADHSSKSSRLHTCQRH